MDLMRAQKVLTVSPEAEVQRAGSPLGSASMVEGGRSP